MNDMLVHPAAEFVERYGDSDYFTTELFDSREAWLEGRKGHLGASDAFKVLDTELRKELFDELNECGVLMAKVTPDEE